MGQGGGGGGINITLPNFDQLFKIRLPTGEEIGQGIEKGGKELLRIVDEPIGEVSGRNMAREQLYLAEKRLKEETAYRNRLIADEQEKAFRMDMQASQAAGKVTQKSSSTSERSPLGTRSLSAAQPIQQKDFLGL